MEENAGKLAKTIGKLMRTAGKTMKKNGPQPQKMLCICHVQAEKPSSIIINGLIDN